MRLLTVTGLVFISLIVLNACKSSPSAEAPASFCDSCTTNLISDTADIDEESFVSINMTNCEPDSITWGNSKMDAYRQMEFTSLAGKTVRLNKDFVRTYIFDTRYAWVLFNDCTSGQGFIVKLPFNKTEDIFRKNSGFNPMDPKYKIHESLVAYTDRGNIFVEEMSTGKKAMMTFGEELVMEYSDMHQAIESVEITPTRVWAKVKIGKEWKEVEKDITLE